MTTVKHTPGPWVVDECNLIFAGMSEIADVYGSNDALCAEGFEAECDANARLISAAPDLLAVAQMLDADWSDDGATPDSKVPEWHPETVRIWKAARAAIAKATGEDAT